MTAREVGMLFTPQLAAKIRSGVKTQTRRLVTANTSFLNGTGKGIRALWPLVDMSYASVRRAGPHRPSDAILIGRGGWIDPRISRGDFVYVREPWSVHQSFDSVRAAMLPTSTPIILKENIGTDGESPEHGRWRPGMHMPKWASKTRLLVNIVRAQRVQDITDEDAKAEGLPPFDFGCLSKEQRLPDGTLMADAPHRASFAFLWDEINGDRCLFSQNPWVWCFTMTVQQ